MLETAVRELGLAIRDQAPALVVEDLVVTILRALEANPDGVERIFHPLGFAQVKLGRAGELGSLKLHVWHPTVRQPDSPPWFVHRHKWQLWSRVLWGGVANELYDVDSALRETASHRLYSVVFDGGASVLKRTRTLVSCKLASRQHLGRGRYYDVPVSNFHSTVVPARSFAATAVLTGPHLGNPAEVVGVIDGEASYRYERRTCPVELLMPLLTRLRLDLLRKR